MEQAKTSPSNVSGGSSKEQLFELVTMIAVLAAAAGVYALLFNRSNVLSHSIGYNLYASERVMEGSVPYRDFHTLYPPATFYLNAALFKWLGVSLHSALLGVLAFKALTIMALYMSGSKVMPRVWALAAALSSLLWLRPNGPFKSVPMHYGALLLAIAMCLLLHYENRRKVMLLFLAGASLGLVALFKHNIGAYALAGSVLLLIFEDPGDVRQTSVCRGEARGALDRIGDKLKSVGRGNYRAAFILLIGCLAVIAPALVYMQANDALTPMIRTLLFGPGEFLLSRLAIPLSPVAPLLVAVAVMIVAYAAHRARERTRIAVGLWLILIVAVACVALRGNQADINQIIFYLPMLVLGGGLGVALFSKAVAPGERRALLILFIFSASALMELFPRFAREQSIAAMPFVMLFLLYLLYVLRPAMKSVAGGTVQYRLMLAVLPMLFLLIEARLFFNTYFESNLRFRASAEVSVERGRGVYFPTATAAVIDSAVGYIQDRLTVDDAAFAQSDAGTSLLFLSKRRNASNAQFWIGVGVTQQERAATLDRIDKSRTKLIITSDEMLAAEKYEPMRNYIERNFKPAVRFDDVLILER